MLTNYCTSYRKPSNLVTLYFGKAEAKDKKLCIKTRLKKNSWKIYSMPFLSLIKSRKEAVCQSCITLHPISRFNNLALMLFQSQNNVTLLRTNLHSAARKFLHNSSHMRWFAVHMPNSTLSPCIISVSKRLFQHTREYNR